MIRKLAKSFTSMGAGKSAREVTSRSSSGSHKASQKARAAKIKQAQQQREQAQAAVVTLKVPAANSSHYLSSAAAEHINQWLIKSKVRIPSGRPSSCL
jgi:predicted dinucleotide-binding enzyme